MPQRAAAGLDPWATPQAYNNAKDFFQTGVTWSNSVNVAQSFDKGNYSFSLGNTTSDGIVRSTGMDRYNVKLSGEAQLHDNWTTGFNGNFVTSKIKKQGTANDGVTATVYTAPISYTMAGIPSHIEGDPYTQNTFRENWIDDGNWACDNNSFTERSQRFFGNAFLKYSTKFGTDNHKLDVKYQIGDDAYTTNYSDIYGYGTTGYTNGYASEYGFTVNEMNSLLTFTYNWNINEDFVFDALLGNELVDKRISNTQAVGYSFNFPGWNHLNNASVFNSSHEYKRKRTVGNFASLSLAWKNMLYLNVTGRNDIVSSMPRDNRSFFYPSISASWVISDMINNRGKGMPEWFTYAKARVSFAQVGNDLDPYQLYNVYGIGSIYETGGTSASVSGSTLFNGDVRSELISSWEAGAEVRFFNNLLGLDVAWYKSNAKRQLLNLPMNSLSGFSSMKINAGNIQNSGVEIMLNATPVQTKEFTWDTQVNFSTNKNKIIELADGINEYTLGTYDNLKILAVAGGNYGEIWGTTYLRVTDENSPYYGKMLLNDAGLPQGDSKIQKIGDQQATCLVGWTNTFSYKNFTLSFLVDARIGGEIFSGSNRMLQANGVAACTVVNGKRDKFVVDGVIADGNGGYSPSTIEVEPQSYWTAVTGSTGNMGIGEANLYDATNVRLRNVSLNYTFPRKMLAKGPFQQVKLGMSCNNVWMIHSNLHGIDPESVFATSTNATGFENASSPTSRTFLFNVTLGF